MSFDHKLSDLREREESANQDMNEANQALKQAQSAYGSAMNKLGNIRHDIRVLQRQRRAELRPSVEVNSK